MHLLPPEHGPLRLQRYHDLLPLLLLPTSIPRVVCAPHGVVVRPRSNCEFRDHPDQHQPVWSGCVRRGDVVRAVHDYTLLV